MCGGIMGRLSQLIASRGGNPMKVLTMGLAMSVVMLPVIGSIVWGMSQFYTACITVRFSYKGHTTKFNEKIMLG
jgi:hypothetical protein